MAESNMKKTSEHVAVRLSLDDVERLDALRADLSAPWHRATRADVLRAAILKGIERLESEPPPSRRRPIKS